MEKDDDGRFSENRTDREVLDAVVAHTPAGTAEVAEALDVTRQAADYRLRRLREEERVRSKKVGGSLIWFAVEEPDEEIDVEPDTDTHREPAPTTDTGEEDDSDPLASVLEDLPATVDPEDGREAILAARDYLQAHGSGSKGEIVRSVMLDHPLGYDPDSALAKLESGERYRGAWWRRVVKPGLEAIDDVEKPPRGAANWTAVEE